jgi:hypothetical protein
MASLVIRGRLRQSRSRSDRCIQDETRYVLWLLDSDDEEADFTGEVPPARILAEVGKLIDQLGVLRTLPVGSGFWRARLHDPSEQVRSGDALGTAPRAAATQANRMSPAGIPMFYGASDADTAIREVSMNARHEEKKKQVTLGRFLTSKACAVVDFTTLPPIPSIFDPELGESRRFLVFLHRFRDDLCKPLGDRVPEIEYVPTQIVTEYLLRVFGHETGVEGLLYSSALDDKVCVVFDVPNDRCVEQVPGQEDDQRLGLVLDLKSIGTGEEAHAT